MRSLVPAKDGVHVGIDVGGTLVRTITRVDGGNPGEFAIHERPADYEVFLAAVVAWIGEPVLGIGIGLPGRVAGGRSLWVPNVPYLTDRALADDVSRRVGAPVTLANDAQCALLAELRSGAAQDGMNVVLVSIGTGIGGAVAYGGRLVRGAHGTAGAFGWLPAQADDAGTVAAERERGPWERRASGSALQRLAREAGVVGARLTVPPDEVTDALMHRYLDDLAPGLAAIASTFDPNRILLSGGVADLLRWYLPELRSRILAQASPVARDVEIRVAQHGAAAGAVGASYLAAEGEGAFLS